MRHSVFAKILGMRRWQRWIRECKERQLCVEIADQSQWGKKRMKRRSVTTVTAFKSPLHNETEKKEDSPENVKKEIQQLESKLKNLEKDINCLKDSGYRVEELDVHIDLMHQYNDIKDVGQVVLGRIAMIDGVRTKDLYKQYGLDLDD